MRGLQANRVKAEGWLEKNAIIVTALNPLIGYAAGAKLVKEALATGRPLRELAVERARSGELRHRDEDRPATAEEITGGTERHAAPDRRRHLRRRRWRLERSK